MTVVAVLGVMVLAVALLVAGWLSWTAGRLDRMHLRVEGARAALDAALARRRALAFELSAGGVTDPASALLLADAATRPVETEPTDERWQRESDLSAVLRAVAAEQGVPTGSPDGIWSELEPAMGRVMLARRIHNDLVGTTLALRARRRVRWFRLAGNAPAVAMIAFDDQAPRPPADQD